MCKSLVVLLRHINITTIITYCREGIKGGKTYFDTYRSLNIIYLFEENLSNDR